MNNTPSPSILFENAAIEDLIAHAIDVLRTKPTDHAARLKLIDLLIVAGDYERADKQADILSNLNTGLATGIALLRRRLRAAAARSDWFEKGAVPAFVGEPTERDRLALALGVATREANLKEISEISAALAKASEALIAKINDGPACVFRDMDDRLPHAIEVLADNGSYIWIDMSHIRSVQLHPISGLRDTVWRRAQVELVSGSQSELIVPATYPQCNTQTLAQTLGCETDWQTIFEGLTVGVGQRCFLSGEDAIGLFEIDTILFKHS